jgi:hypothetical protein
MSAQRSVLGLAHLAVVAVTLTACATGGDSLGPSSTFTTLMPGWESKFSLEWEVSPVADGSRIVYGRVSNRWGQYAQPFTLLGQALDSTDQVVDQRVQRVPSGVPAFTTTYFEFARLAAADHYKVTVWSYSFIEERGIIQ